MDEQGRLKSAQAYQVIGQLSMWEKNREPVSDAEIRRALDYFNNPDHYDDGICRGLGWEKPDDGNRPIRKVSRPKSLWDERTGNLIGDSSYRAAGFRRMKTKIDERRNK